MDVFNGQARYTEDSATFIFHERLQVVMLFKTYEVLVVKDDKVIDRVNYMGEPFSMSDLELVFKQSIESAGKL
jgi:hypothetical protein